MKCSGIYITDNTIRFGEAASNGQDTLKEEEINIASLKDEEVSNAIRGFFKENRTAPEYLILCLPRIQISIKHLSLPASDDAEIRQMAEFELNNLFPCKPEELIVDYAVTRKSKDGYSEVILFAAPREIIFKQISTLKQAGIVPDAISISTVSLFNQLCKQKRPLNNYLLINLDDSFMEMMFISERKLSFSRGISFDKAAAKSELIRAVDSTVTVLKDKGDSIDGIILSGKGLDLNDFAKSLEENVSYKVEIDDSLSVLKGLTSKSNGEGLKINLLPQELRIKKEKSERRMLLLRFAALLVLNLALLAQFIFMNVRAKERYLYALKSEIKKIEPAVSELQNKAFGIQMLRGYIKSGRLTLGLLSELYRLAPERINLSYLDISPQKDLGIMLISGQANGSESVLKFASNLKASKLIKKADVSYIKKIKSTTQEDLVDFEIKVSF